MILDIGNNLFYEKFPVNPHLFVSKEFVGLNKSKVDKIVCLVQNSDKIQMGLVAGIRDNILLSPFSAPFGGFHFKHDNIYTGAIESFIYDLINYAKNENLKSIKITLAPDIYAQSVNAKIVNVATRLGLIHQTPEITNWVDLNKFQKLYTHAASRTYYNQSVKKGLSFHLVTDIDEMKLIYNLIVENRARMGRPIFMSFNDLIETAQTFPTEYFKVIKPTGELVAGAIFYRPVQEIPYAVFWGDAEEGRMERAMDFLIFQLWCFYKNSGGRFVDLGISTETGIPNEGLLRFKETHESCSSLRYTIAWHAS